MGSKSQAIAITDLSKHFLVPEREAGTKAALGSLFKRRNRVVKAVDGISANISESEVVGFLGPNGAGKTTTLKMLSGLLHPTSGGASVLGYQPWDRDRDYLRQITMVMGQRNQLQWDIPAADSYDLQRAIYRIPAEQFRQTVAEFVELLDLGLIIKKPVRNLSLGERMKVEIAGTLLHRPRVLFLDEPTIGLDVSMQRRIRTFVVEYNQRYGATVLLTSHYMADIVALCQRVIVIHHGQILYDGDLSGLAKRFNTHKKITIKLTEDRLDLSSYGEVLSNNLGIATLRVPIMEVPRSTARLLAEVSVMDLTIEDPPIEDTIVQVFSDVDES
ncbi:MAG: ABC transporter ATP-binding protein [Anaerolineales bacterium]